ncbi:MAG: hypothetical protein JO148_06695, partial [Acidimicrobiia bacterium]|nr:hypothetical protein [Acidimicrobiia bacterium]
MRRVLTLLAIALAAATTLAAVRSAAPAQAATTVAAPGGVNCTPPGTPITVVVGTVACQELTSHLLG